MTESVNQDEISEHIEAATDEMNDFGEVNQQNDQAENEQPGDQVDGEQPVDQADNEQDANAQQPTNNPVEEVKPEVPVIKETSA